MTYGEMGMAFSMLLKYRELHGNPIDRPIHDNELEAVRYLAGCSSDELQEFDEFLEAQGFSLITIEAFNLGIPPKAGRDNVVFLLTRRRDTKLAPYLNSKWFIEQMRDDRGNMKDRGNVKPAKKAELTFWLARMWLTLQWFFYQKDGRPTSSESGYRNALVSEKRFIEVLEDGIEELLKKGRPDGDSGYMWDVLKGSKSAIPRYVRKFLKIMLDAGMIQKVGDAEYRQSLLAAVEMKENYERELTYLLPASNEEDIAAQTIALLNGNAEGV